MRIKYAVDAELWRDAGLSEAKCIESTEQGRKEESTGYLNGIKGHKIRRKVIVNATRKILFPG